MLTNVAIKFTKRSVVQMLRGLKFFGLGAALGLLALFILAAGNFGQVGGPGLASATQGQPPGGMVLIPSGSFQMGDNFGDGNSGERPVHTVFVSAFYMDQYEVRKSLWDEVATWAATHGYDIGPGSADGKAPGHPVYNVTWYEAVKWANARSEAQGLTPCYYTGALQLEVYRRGDVNVPVEGVRWSGCGFRLPTEAEWEKAARGGATGHRFPWSDTDTIQHERANYYSCPAERCSSGYSYDTSPTRGDHPTYATGSTPYTSPVGSFAPNGYGLYDMAGNVYEWVWDQYGSDYYSRSTASDPRGPAPDSGRVFRGGSWGDGAYYCRVASRRVSTPGYSYNFVGFRLVRTAP
jgi:sulfatase modifying factor 1